jgi:hypothetical protein
LAEIGVLPLTDGWIGQQAITFNRLDPRQTRIQIPPSSTK